MKLIVTVYGDEEGRITATREYQIDSIQFEPSDEASNVTACHRCFTIGWKGSNAHAPTDALKFIEFETSDHCGLDDDDAAQANDGWWFVHFWHVPENYGLAIWDPK